MGTAGCTSEWRHPRVGLPVCPECQRLRARAEAAEARATDEHGKRISAERLLATAEAKLAEAERERNRWRETAQTAADHRFDPMADRVIVTGEGWRALKAQAARVEALEGALLEKIREWHANGRAEEHLLIAGTWKLCADDVSAALAAGRKP